MKRLLIIIAILALVVVGAVAFYFYANRSDQPSGESPIPAVTPLFPVGGGGDEPPVRGTLTIQTVSGTTLEVRDFTRDPEVLADAVNPGSYVLAGELGYCLPDGSCPFASDVRDFSITYTEDYQAFTITLLKEPVGETRRAAEGFLREKLALNDANLCLLRYHIGVPSFVNETYTGRNLGFSFCPGAVKLP